MSHWSLMLGVARVVGFFAGYPLLLGVGKWLRRVHVELPQHVSLIGLRPLEENTARARRGYSTLADNIEKLSETFKILVLGGGSR